jgi:hypothetical protein
MRHAAWRARAGRTKRRYRRHGRRARVWGRHPARQRAECTLKFKQVNGWNSSWDPGNSSECPFGGSLSPRNSKLLFLELFLSRLAASGPGIAGIAKLGISGAISLTSALFGLSDTQITVSTSRPPESESLHSGTVRKLGAWFSVDPRPRCLRGVSEARAAVRGRPETDWYRVFTHDDSIDVL